MNVKPKLLDSTSLLESEDEINDEQIIFARQRHICKSEYNKTENKDDMSSIPESVGQSYKRPKVPEMKEQYVPSLYSNTYKYSGPTDKEEILATMDTCLNRPTDDKDQLPDL